MGQCILNTTNLRRDSNVTSFISKVNALFREYINDYSTFRKEFNSSLKAFCESTNLAEDPQVLDQLSELFANKFSKFSRISKDYTEFVVTKDFITSLIQNSIGTVERTEDKTYTEELLDIDNPIQSRLDANTEFLEHAYGKNIKIRMEVEQETLNKLVNAMFIHRDTKNSCIVTTDAEVNANLRNYKQELMNHIIDYAHKYANMSDEDFILYQHMYDSKGNLSSDKITLSKFDDLFKNMSENELNSLYQTKYYEKQVNSEYALKYDAYNALVMLKNLDTYIVHRFGKTVKFKNFNSLEGNNYALSEKGTGTITTWRTKDDSDVDNEIDIITRSFIETIPMYRYGTNTPKEHSYLNFQDFTSLISKLNNLLFDKDIRNNIITSNRLKEVSEETAKIIDENNVSTAFETKTLSLSDIICFIRLNPQKWTKVLFEVLSDSTFRQSIGYKLNDTDFDIIYSLNKAVFTGDNSLYNINANFVDTNYYGYITQVIDSLSQVNFMQYYKTEEGAIGVRSLTDQKVDEVKRRAEENIALSSINFGDYKIKKLPKDDNFLYRLEFEIPLSQGDTLKVRVSTIEDEKYSVTSFFSKGKSWDNVLNNEEDKIRITKFIKDVLKVDLIKDQGFERSISSNLKSPYLNLFKFASRVLLNKYINEVELSKVRNNRKINRKDLLEFFVPKSKNFPKINKNTNSIEIISKLDIKNLYALARSISEAKGYTSATIVKDGEGNAQNRVSLSRLLGKLGIQFKEQCLNDKSILKNCLLLNIPGLLHNIYTAKEFKDTTKTTQHTDFTVADFAYSQLIFDFVEGLYNSESKIVGNGLIALYPSVNSDKGTIGRIIIDTNLQITLPDGTTKKLRDVTIPEMKGLIIHEFADIYNNMFDNITTDLTNVLMIDNDYKKIYGVNNAEALKANIAVDYFNNFSKINEYCLNTNKSATSFLNEKVKAYNNEILNYNRHHRKNKKELIHLTDQLHFSSKKGMISSNIGLIQNLYRFGNYKDVVANMEEGAFDAIIKNNKLTTDKEFWEEKHAEIIESCLKGGVYFNLNNSKQPGIKAIKGWCTGKNAKWISDTNKLVLAKYTLKGKEYDITSDESLNVIDDLRELINKESIKNPDLTPVEILRLHGELTLNPIIEMHNYYDYLFTQEFMLATVGTYLAHPNKNKAAKYALEYIAGNFNAQVKRNVSMTAQMHEFQLNALDGTPSDYNIAVTEDVKDTQINVYGNVDDGLKPYDGATFVNPFIVYLENNSLGAQRAGVHKKQFVHFYDEHTSSGGIIKTAGFGLNNEWMRSSKLLQDMMYNMTNRTWEDLECTYNILLDYNNEEIKLDPIYFKSGSNFYKRELQKVPTEEAISIIKTNPELYGNFNPNYVYKKIDTLVDVCSNPKRSDNAVLEDYIDIDTNYKLWRAFGAEKSCKIVKGKLKYSETSVANVVKVMNSVGELQEGVIKPRTQEDLYQPLKHSDIHYIPTIGAVKQGAANINPKSTYYQRTDLNFMKIHMYQAGIQLDKEHGADLEDLSLMTQVISACSARGYSLKKADDLYEALRFITEIRTKDIGNIFNEIYNNEVANSDKLRQVVTKLIVDGLMHSSGTKSLINYMADNLITEARNGNLEFKDEHIAGSANGVYNKLVSLITVFFNKTGIKQKVPGVLAVLTPSYDIIKLYDGKKLDQYDDGVDNLKDRKIINPIDIDFERTYRIDDKLIKIKTYDTYAEVRNAIRANKDVYEVLKEGRNLSSYNFRFGVKGDNGNIEYFQMYDMDITRFMFKVHEHNSKEIIPELTMEANNTFNLGLDVETSTIQDILNRAHHVVQQSLDAVSNTTNRVKVLIDGRVREVVKGTVQVSAAEVGMSKNFATNFGLEVGDELTDIQNDPYFFTRRMVNNFNKTNLNPKQYTFKLGRLSGKHIYLTTKEAVGSNLTEKVIKKQVEVDGTVNRLRESGDGSIMYQMSSINDKIYVNSRGDEVIVTDNPKFYLNNMSYNDIQISPNVLEENINLVINSIKESNNRVALQLYVELQRFKDTPKVLKEYLVDRAKAYKTLLYSDDYNIQAKDNSIFKEHFDHIFRIGGAIHASWEKSLDIVAARIPAQSMQSFMPMKIAMYIDSDVNVAYVNTSQIWLQGSDYDIDAVSLATVDIDDNGMLQTSSPFANVSTIKDLREALEYIPFKTDNKVNYITDKLNNEEVQNIIDNLNSFLHTGIILSDGNSIYLNPYANNKNIAAFLTNTWVFPEAESIALYPELNKKIPMLGLSYVEVFNGINNILSINNNYLSSISSEKLLHITNNKVHYSMFSIIEDPINAIQAQTSVDATTGPLKAKSNESLEAKALLTCSPGNVYNKYESVVSNQVGRKAIGICATGLKAFFAATQYYNKLLNSGQIKDAEFNIEMRSVSKKYHYLANLALLHTEDVNVNSDEFKILLDKFNNDYDAVVILETLLNDVSLEARQKIIETFVADNPDIVLNQNIKELKEVLGNTNDAAVILSALLSLATDNAKELALSKLNAGDKTLGMYIFGISIGMDFEDIANIMMSDTALTLSKIMAGNPFNGIQPMTSFSQVFSYFKKPNLYKYFDVKTIKEVKELDTLNYLFGEANTDIKAIVRYTNDLMETVRNDRNKVQEEKARDLSLLEFYKNYYIQKYSLDQNVLEDLKTLYRGAEEFKLLGRLLGLNQGMKTNPDDLQNTIKDVQELLLTAYNNFPDKNSVEKPELIDLGKFAFNEKYQEEVIYNYEKLKNTVNIPAIMLKVQHFGGYLKMLAEANSAIENYACKYRFSPKLVKFGNEVMHNANRKLTGKKVQFLVDNSITRDWILKSAQNEDTKDLVTYTIKKGSIILGYKFIEDTEIVLGSKESNDLFKAWVENVVIPNLKNGITSEDKISEMIASNAFISDLQPVLFNKTPDDNYIINYTCSTSLLPNDAYEQAEFDKRKIAFNQLCNYNYFGKPLVNILYLYNQIAFNGRVGQVSWNKLFEDQRNRSIIKSHENYIRNLDLDQSLDTLDIEKTTIIEYLAQRANHFAYGNNKEYIRDFDDTNTRLVVYKKKKEDNSKNTSNKRSNFDLENMEDMDIAGIQDFEEGIDEGDYNPEEDLNYDMGDDIDADLANDYSDELEEFNTRSKKKVSDYYELFLDTKMNITNYLEVSKIAFKDPEGVTRDSTLEHKITSVIYKGQLIDTSKLNEEFIIKPKMNNNVITGFELNTENLDTLLEKENMHCELKI